MDEEPGAVINRLLEDGDVQIMILPRPLLANVVRRPVQQTLHNFGRIRKLSPICCTTLLGSKKPGNKKSSPWISYFLGGGSKTQEIRNPAPWISYFLGLGPAKNQRNKNSSPRFLNSCVFGPAKKPGNKKSSPDFSFRNPYQISYQISTIHPLPSGEFRNARRFATGILSPSKRPDQIFTFAACLRANSETLADLLQES